MLSVLKTPRGMGYIVLTLLLVFSMIFSLKLVFGIVAAGFFGLRVLQALSEGFRCEKCLIGLASAVCMALTAVFGFSLQLFIITLATMWVDVWVHGT